MVYTEMLYEIVQFKNKKNIIKNEFLLQPLIKYIIFKRNLMQK